MKWINHKLSTFSLVYLFTGNFLASCISAVGSILPDMLEGRAQWTTITIKRSNSKYQKRVYNLPRWHRTITHWFITYLAIIVYSLAHSTELFKISITNLSFYLSTHFSDKYNTFSLYVLFWLSVGCLMHIIQDSLTGRVPLFNPYKKSFSLRVMRTGSILEYLMSLILVTITFYVYILKR